MLEGVNDMPEEFLELLNKLIHREEGFYLTKDFVNLMRAGGLEVIGNDQKTMKIVLATTRVPEKKEALSRAKGSIPGKGAMFLEEAQDALARGDAKTCLGRCRDVLESFSREFGRYVKSIEGSVISSQDRSILDKTYGYLSDLGSHPNVPNVEQGRLGLDLTEGCVVFLVRSLKAGLLKKEPLLELDQPPRRGQESP